MTRPFNTVQIDFINDLLQRISKGHVTYYQLDYKLYDKHFHLVKDSSEYPLFRLVNDTIQLEPLGNKIVNQYNSDFGLYLDTITEDQQLDKSIKQLTKADLEKTDRRSKKSLVVSIVAIIVAILVGGMQVYQTYHYNKNRPNKSDNTQNQTDIGSEIYHSQHPSDFIDTTFIKEKSDISNLISN
jgi:hypothetical protein